MTKLKTTSKFIEELSEAQPQLKLIGDYGSAYVIVKNEFGLMKCSPHNILNKKNPPGIKSAIDKTAYFTAKYNKIWGDNSLKILSDYRGLQTKIRVETPYGDCLISADNLIQHNMYSIASAIDKTSYWIKQAREVHGDRYDYSKVEYNNCYDLITIICHKHGEFKQQPFKHLSNRGCPECGKEHGHWTKEHYITSARGRECSLYLIKCWNDTEEFWKVGITFQGIATRFSGKIPYKWELIREIRGDAGFIWELEKDVHLKNKSCKYLPKLAFNGRTECFNKIPCYEIKYR